MAAISLCAGAMAAATTERQSLLACCAGVSHKAEHPTSREVQADMWEITMGGAPLACARGRAKATLVLAPTSVGTNGHRRGVLVLAAHGPKLRNFGAHTCRPQCVPDRVDFGVCRCQHQSYVTLALTSVGSNPG